jgi:CheY-like chemotaxis protein
MNLVINASEAIGEGSGVIRVSTSRRDGDHVRLEVSDNGPGMSEETRARIFDPFFSTKATGRGLGLAVVQAIVRRFGGSVNVTSTLGKGAQFEILLPSVSAKAVDACSAVAIDRAPAPSATVLMVEDEKTLRNAVSKMLRRKGFLVAEAGDGHEAVEALASDGKIDVVLLDLTIPGPSGHELISEVRMTRPDAKIVVTTAYSREMAAQYLESDRVKGFIRKPYQITELVELLRSVVG